MTLARPTSPRLRIVTMLLAASVVVLIPRFAGTQSADITPPTLAPAVLSPSGPEQYGTGTAGRQTVRGTGLGNWNTTPGGVTVTLSASDDVSVDRFQYAIVAEETGASGTRATPPGPRATAPGDAQPIGPCSGGVEPEMAVVSARAAPSSFVTLAPRVRGATASVSLKLAQEGAMVFWYRAVDAAGNMSALRSMTLAIDTRLPTASFPGLVNYRVGHSATLTPERHDAVPGSGGVLIRETEIDSRFAYPTSLDVSTLTLGKHTWSVTPVDAAGNASKVMLTFVVTTSFDDVATLLGRYARDGIVSTATYADLHGRLEAARTASAERRPIEAASALGEFVTRAHAAVTNTPARALLEADGADLARQVRGGAARVYTGLGVTAVRAPQAQQDRFVAPLLSASRSDDHSDARFKVLVMTNCADGFRHESILATERMIGELGREHGFAVDVYDYAFPEMSVENPLTSLGRLSQYRAIVAVSSEGSHTFASKRRQPDGSVVDEQQLLQAYVRGGGGFVALHGAADSMHGWEWYQSMVGAEIAGHVSDADRAEPECPTCRVTEVTTEDASHPATSHFAKTWRVRDEFPIFRASPRAGAHVLLSVDDALLANAIDGPAGSIQRIAIPGTTWGLDHPVSWCQNFEGGRVFTDVLMHNWELVLDPAIRRHILGGIEWAAGAAPGNCVTHREVAALIKAGRADGSLIPAVADHATSLVDAAFKKYLDRDFQAAAVEIEALLALADDRASGAEPRRRDLTTMAKQLEDWMVTLGAQRLEARGR